LPFWSHIGEISRDFGVSVLCIVKQYWGAFIKMWVYLFVCPLFLFFVLFILCLFMIQVIFVLSLFFFSVDNGSRMWSWNIRNFFLIKMFLFYLFLVRFFTAWFKSNPFNFEIYLWDKLELSFCPSPSDPSSKVRTQNSLQPWSETLKLVLKILLFNTSPPSHLWN